VRSTAHAVASVATQSSPAAAVYVQTPASMQVPCVPSSTTSAQASASRAKHVSETPGTKPVKDKSVICVSFPLCLSRACLG
jgi:hypothetical protein